MSSSIWAVYKSCLQEVQALWLFYKYVMSQVTSSILCGWKGLGVQVNKVAFSILYIARCHGYGSFCFSGNFRPVWKTGFYLIFTTPPLQNAKLFQKTLHITTKYHPWPSLRKQNYCFKYHPCAIFASCIRVCYYLFIIQMYRSYGSYLVISLTTHTSISLMSNQVTTGLRKGYVTS